MISLESFLSGRKLSVHHVRVEPRKVKASYSIENYSGESSSFELIYSYDKPYFKRNNPADVNLACMMLSQVAINYGLFFESIEFDGLFEKADQQFIREMTENTSREILTNKLLIRNEFLKASFVGLKAGKRASYTQAKILFSNTRFEGLKVEPEVTETDPDKYVILSSGGKDSLLSYGIIREIGEAYPVFINEAGRHWFTAVNSYRYYKETDANTEKPWCNSDRLFNWMLGHLPFIKENHASIRADIYPVRLWTVAVFLFGVLPIARKKAAGNILIGDEYDTTMKGNLEGISHYHGLYDQSKYFDNALSRYYRKKAWNIYQFSLLRSMSEILIMKALIKRYPELQKHQISCHAAHELEGRMYPCGKCEKCRRIIGMIRSLDENPEKCGYSADQIGNGLDALASKSVKQIGSDAAHLYHLLLEKNLIIENEFTRGASRQHPEIMKLRFDQERSNLEDMPMHVRKPLFKILNEYSEGAVIRKGKQWTDFEINDEFLHERNYLFDEKRT